MYDPAKSEPDSALLRIKSEFVTSSDANVGCFLLVSQEVLCSQAWLPGLLASEAQQPASWEGEELPQG